MPFKKSRTRKSINGKLLERLTWRLLRGMGEPEEQDFIPSPFQQQALQKIREHDVVVVAPTGSGKTWIAERAIARLLEEGKQSWYTTPLKALSNQKYERFQELFGAERVGLLTGERRENSGAPAIVATTEVLRNHLYSLNLNEPASDLIVLDEAHYIADPERGTTWEEVVILASPATRLLLLSATISNPDDIVGWMAEVRRHRVELVVSTERPVPLRYGFLSKEGMPLPLNDKVPTLVLRRSTQPFDPVWIVRTLQAHDLLPAIIFLPRRRDCDEAVYSFRFARFLLEDREEREAAFGEVAANYPRIWTHPHRHYLIQCGVAAHHAGHLTAWKVVVERMLRRGLIKAVFATTTLAAGLDVPARTVVLPCLTIRDESGERPLSALEFHQMTGRAGRLGKDKVGFVLIAPRRRMDLEIANALKEAEPESLVSAFRVQYFQVLNLLSRHGMDGALKILDQSLAVYQQAQFSRRKAHAVRQGLRGEFKQRAKLLQELGYLTPQMELTELGRWALLIRHERSLFIVETIRRGFCDNTSIAQLAGWAAAFTTERFPRFSVAHVDVEPLIEVAEEIEELEWRMDVPPSNFAETFEREQGAPSESERKAAVVQRWAEGAEWEALIHWSGSEEGDLQRLVLQAAEVLRQMEDLPLPVALLAREAREAILTSPVI